jgi:hypothetical protein
VSICGFITQTLPPAVPAKHKAIFGKIQDQKGKIDRRFFEKLKTKWPKTIGLFWGKQDQMAKNPRPSESNIRSFWGKHKTIS